MQVGSMVAAMLRNNGTLQTLDLRTNRLGKSGLTALAEGCTQNSSLRDLLLNNNGRLYHSLLFLLCTVWLTITCQFILSLPMFYLLLSAVTWFRLAGTTQLLQSLLPLQLTSSNSKQQM